MTNPTDPAAVEDDGRPYELTGQYSERSSRERLTKGGHFLAAAFRPAATSIALAASA